VERAILGKAIPDPDLLAQAPDAIVAKIERALGALSKIKGRGGEWDLGKDLEDAVRTIVEVKATEAGSVGALRRQGSLLEQAGPSSRADTLADALLTVKDAPKDKLVERLEGIIRESVKPMEKISPQVLDMNGVSALPSAARSIPTITTRM